MFENSLLNIKENLSMKSSTREELSKVYIAKRLNKSLVTYREELESNLKYLTNRKPENVLKRM